MKRNKKLKFFIAFFAGTFLIVLTSSLVYCGSTAKRLLSSIKSGDNNNFDKYFNSGMMCFGKIDNYNQIPKLLNGQYLVLFQNNYELRPTGGFMGSYAVATFKDGVFKGMVVDDIYTPEGQIKGHVVPETPFQQAFKTGDYSLENSNWDPDFPTAVSNILWFFDKGGVKDIDGVIAINLSLVPKILEITGPVKPLDYPETLNSSNFYEITQSYSQDNFFEGSRSKKNYLSAVSRVLLEKLSNLSIRQYIMLGQVVKNELDSGQILLWSENSDTQNLISNSGWDGKLAEYDYDYFYSVESNLGSNKSNCCITRSVEQKVTIDGKVLNEITIVFKNDSNTATNKWSGDYFNFERILLSKNAEPVQVVVGGEEYSASEADVQKTETEPWDDNTYLVEQLDNYLEVGFWVVVKQNDTNIVKLKYVLPKKEIDYNIVVQRQPGIAGFPYKLTVNNETVVDEDVLVLKTFYKNEQ